MSEAWETSKENVLPVKRGRSAKGLSDALSAPVDEGETSSIIAAFESELKGAPATGADMLDIYVRYFKWVRDKFPANAARAMQVLEQATAQLAHNKGCKNDIRFVKLWIEYADLVRAPGDIFSYMQANKIGESVALFWAGWAFVAEKHENFSLADQIFQKGIKKGAEPKDMLAKRYQQYQRRMARRFLNSMHGEGGDVGEASGTAAASAGGSGAATSQTDENAPSGRGNSGSSRARSALGHLAGSERPSRSAAPAQAPPPAAAAGGKAPKSKGNGGSTFAIYSEPDREEATAPLPAQAQKDRGGRCGKMAAGGVALEDCGSEGWRVLGSEAGRRKENDGPVSKFTDGGVVAARPAPPAGATLNVFVDDEFQNQDPDKVGEEPQEQQKEQTEARKGVLSIRRALEQAAPVISEEGVGVDQIMRNPLARHPAAPPKAGAAPAAGKRAPSSKSTTAAPTAPKEAPSAKSKKAPAPIPTPPASGGSFAIFRDEAAAPVTAAEVDPVAKKSNKPAAATKAPEASGGGFAIFCDEEPEAPVVGAPAAIPAPAAKTSSPATKTVPQEVSTPSYKAGDVIACSDVLGSGGCTLSLSRAHNRSRSRNLSTASANSSVGGATATINTKLAMMDIEMMFCDDEPEAPVPAVARAPVVAAADTTADMGEVQRLLRNLDQEGESHADSATPAAAMPTTDKRTDGPPPLQNTAPCTQSRPATQPDKLLFTCGGLVSDIKKVGEHGRDSGAFDYHQHYVGDGAPHMSSRRRTRCDSDSHDFGHCVASPTITFTSSVIPSAGAVPAPAACSGSGIPIYQDSPQAPAIAPVSQRSKRPKKLNDCWAGIDDLLADEPEPAHEPVSAPAEVAVSHRSAPAFAVYCDGDGDDAKDGDNVARSRETAGAARRRMDESRESDGDDSLCLNDLLKAAEN